MLASDEVRLNGLSSLLLSLSLYLYDRSILADVLFEREDVFQAGR